MPTSYEYPENDATRGKNESISRRLADWLGVVTAFFIVLVILAGLFSCALSVVAK